MPTSLGPAPVPAYVDDIRQQPAALQDLLDAGLGADVEHLLSRIRQFDRVVLTGMGASLFGLYPAFLRLAQAGLPVWLSETAELLGPARGLLTPRTLLWITSQSGATAEVVELLEQLEGRPAGLLATTNDTASPLASAADAVLELRSGAEHAVGTRSYINTLAATSLAVSRALDESEHPEMAAGPETLAAYLGDWDAHIMTLDRLVPESTMFVLGRGPSLAAATTGGLIIKEAAGRAVEGMSVPQFRHGPLEMAGPGVTVVLLAGDATYHALNRDMERDLTSFGARAVWTDTTPGPNGCPMPHLVSPQTRPMAEILPLQLLSVVLAERAGRQPGAFSKIGKVTRTL